MCVARHTPHHDGSLTWNEPSPQQRVENTNLYFQKDISEELVCSYGSVRAGYEDGPSLTSILYVDSSTQDVGSHAAGILATTTAHTQTYEIV